MFSIEISRRRLLGAAALASGILIMAAALLYGHSVRAQTGAIPLGTYVATVAEAGQFTDVIKHNQPTELRLVI